MTSKIHANIDSAGKMIAPIPDTEAEREHY